MREAAEHDTPEFEPDPDAPVDDDDDESSDGEDEQPSGMGDAPEPQGHGPSPEEIEKAFKRIETSWNTYAKSVERNHPSFEEDLIACLLCPPAHPGFLNVHDAGRVPKEVVDAVQMFLGLAREKEYRADPDTRECGVCGGEGKVERPTHVHEFKVTTCKSCRGYGFVPPPGDSSNGTAADHADVITAEASVPSGPPPDVDEWGEPRILPDGRANPNYGRMPVHKVAVEPWGATAGLTAQS